MDSLKLWLEALRSGKYEQGCGQLCYLNRFCCLGVACDLYQKHVGGLVITGLEFNERYYNGCKGQLPGIVRDWLGLRNVNGSFGTNSLTIVNDNGATFKEIADLIEKRPDGLFKTVA